MPSNVLGCRELFCRLVEVRFAIYQPFPRLSAAIENGLQFLLDQFCHPLLDRHIPQCALAAKCLVHLFRKIEVNLPYRWPFVLARCHRFARPFRRHELRVYLGSLHVKPKQESARLQRRQPSTGTSRDERAGGGRDRAGPSMDTVKEYYGLIRKIESSLMPRELLGPGHGVPEPPGCGPHIRAAIRSLSAFFCRFCAYGEPAAARANDLGGPIAALRPPRSARSDSP